MAGEDWKRLADYVIRARVKHGYRTRQSFALAIGVTATTLGVLERDHRSVSRDTLAAIEDKLEWAPGAAQAVLEGGEPALAKNHPEPPRQETNAELIARAETALREAAALLDELRNRERRDAV